MPITPDGRVERKGQSPHEFVGTTFPASGYYTCVARKLFLESEANKKNCKAKRAAFHKRKPSNVQPRLSTITSYPKPTKVEKCDKSKAVSAMPPLVPAVKGNVKRAALFRPTPGVEVFNRMVTLAKHGLDINSGISNSKPMSDKDADSHFLQRERSAHLKCLFRDIARCDSESRRRKFSLLY